VLLHVLPAVMHERLAMLDAGDACELDGAIPTTIAQVNALQSLTKKTMRTTENFSSLWEDCYCFAGTDDAIFCVIVRFIILTAGICLFLQVI